MNVYVDRLPNDTRVLPADPRLHERPTVLPLDEHSRLDAHVANCTGPIAWVEVGSVADVRRAAAAGAGLWLRGLEAGGRHGADSALVLLRAAASTGRPWVVQGLGRRGMAAALAVGAHGVQVDVHTWLLDDSPLDAQARTALTRRSARDTQLSDGMRTLAGLPVSCAIADATPGPSLDVWWPAFAERLVALLELAASDHPLHSDPFGTGTPIVQGPMANVSERPGLALAVRRAGGLPFCALGALRPDAAREVLDGMAAVAEPWGAGVIGFDVMPHRDDHLTAVQASGPRPVVLAGGSPALAIDLQRRGLEPWLHTPSARLAGMAVRRGVKAVVFEGTEAGGHVGKLPSTALWEEALHELECAEQPILIVLAGGIGDPVSSAFAGAMAATAHRAGHRIGLQVGTAFFFTHEIVEQGGITSTYQQRALSAESTVLVGATVDLPLRCTPNLYTDDAIAQEHAWARDELPLRERRQRVEHHNLGRTRIAAKGISRDGRGGYARLPVRRQLEQGAFTMGQGAAVEHALTSVQSLIQGLTVGAASLLEHRSSPPIAYPSVETAEPPVVAPTSVPLTRRASTEDPIAVVGLGCVLPGAPTVDAFWQQLRFGMNAIRTVPDHRWRNDRYFHPDPSHSSTTSYVRMAGVIDGFTFDSTPFGIPPRVVASMDRAQQLTLTAAAQAIRGVRIADRSRSAVFIGNSMGGEHAKSLAVRVRFREVLAALGRDGDEALERAVDAVLATSLPPVDVESMAGLLSNVIAGRVASWLDLGGGNATVDAACAASLGALTMAVDALRSNRCDLVLTGGVDADLSPETFVGFCRTHALSPSGSQPFSSRADGFVMGEGAVVFALKRLSDAERHGDPIHALVRGIGMASDGRSKGITAPRAGGQELALRRALADAGVDADTVEMIEAHGTGTSLGDQTEITALAAVYPRAVVGSVKSQIGHLKGGAGAAGMLKAILALREGVIPPTLNAGPLRPEVRASPFTVPRRPGSFTSAVRRAGVSAFGFGGTNYHVVLEGRGSAPSAPHAVQAWTHAAPRIEVFGGDDAPALAAAIRAGHTCTPEEASQFAFRATRIGEAPGLEAWVAGGGTGAFARSAWVASGPVQPVVLVFPGQGSKRAGAQDVLARIPSSAAVLDALGTGSLDTNAGPAAQHHLLVALGAAYAGLMQTTPTAGVVGHSVGELSALCAAGVLSPSAALELADARGGALHDCPPGAMLAVVGEDPCPDSLWVAADNSPGARVFAGASADIAHTESTLKNKGTRCTRLDVERAFHTPHVQPAADALAHILETTELAAPTVPWWPNVPVDVSTTTGIRRALVRGVTETVGFRGSVRAAADQGHGIFVHMGPGASLARHIQRTSPDAVVVSLHPDHDPEGADLVRAAAHLCALGHPGLLRQLPGTFVSVAFPRRPLARPVPTGTTLEVVAPAPPAPPQASERPVEELVDDGSVRSQVVRVISEVTGYPRAALVSGASLDADLGIDSIRKMEILGRIQEDLDLTLDEQRLAEVDDLDIDALVALVEQGSAPIAIDTSPACLWSVGWRPARAQSGPPPRRFIVHGQDLSAALQALRDELLATPLVGPGGMFVPHDDPVQRGAAAYLRVAASEVGQPFRTLIGHGNVLPDDRWWLGSGDVHFVDGVAVEPVAATWQTVAELPDAPVVLATGGTTGIVAQCLARWPGAVGVVLGRRAGGSPPPGFSTATCDVTDAEAVNAAVAACRALHGRIDVVLHGAGVLRDGAARTADDASIAAVVDVKLHGARNLIAATLPDAPVWIPFSSVSATLDNPGQAVYAAANRALEVLRHPTAVRQVPIAWTAWSAHGMAADPALQRLLASRGIRSLTPDEGASLFLRALRGDGRAWAAHAPWPTTGGWPSPTPEGQTLTLEPTSPVLADHVVAGAPLVAGALWVAALLANGPVVDFRILVPTTVRRRRVARVHTEGIEVDGVSVVRCAPVAPPAAPAPVESLAVVMRDAAELYRPDVLFHGRTWQVLQAYGVHVDGAEATVEATGPSVALLIDAVHQLLAVWTLETAGWLGLPTGAAGWWVPVAPTGKRFTVVVRASVDGSVCTADATVLDAAGTAVLHATRITVEAAT